MVRDSISYSVCAALSIALLGGCDTREQKPKTDAASGAVASDVLQFIPKIAATRLDAFASVR